MTQLDLALVGILAGLTIGLVQAIKAPFGKRLDRFGSWIALAVGCALSAVWTQLGATIPEGVTAWAYFAVHGIAAGLTACSLYAVGKAGVKTISGNK